MEKENWRYTLVGGVIVNMVLCDKNDKFVKAIMAPMTVTHNDGILRNIISFDCKTTEKIILTSSSMALCIKKHLFLQRRMKDSVVGSVEYENFKRQDDDVHLRMEDIVFAIENEVNDGE